MTGAGAVVIEGYVLPQELHHLRHIQAFIMSFLQWFTGERGYWVKPNSREPRWGIIITDGHAEVAAIGKLRGRRPSRPKSFIRSLEKHGFERHDGEPDIWYHDILSPHCDARNMPRRPRDTGRKFAERPRFRRGQPQKRAAAAARTTSSAPPAAAVATAAVAFAAEAENSVHVATTPRRSGRQARPRAPRSDAARAGSAAQRVLSTAAAAAAAVSATEVTRAPRRTRTSAAAAAAATAAAAAATAAAAAAAPASAAATPHTVRHTTTSPLALKVVSDINDKAAAISWLAAAWDALLSEAPDSVCSLIAAAMAAESKETVPYGDFMAAAACAEPAPVEDFWWSGDAASAADAAAAPAPAAAAFLSCDIGGGDVELMSDDCWDPATELLLPLELEPLLEDTCGAVSRQSSSHLKSVPYGWLLM